MTKSEYLSNSAKLFAVNGIILFIANAFIFAGNFNAQLGAYGTKLANYTFFIILVLAFLALNGEGIGYKRHKDFINKKRIKLLKLLLLFVFILRYAKVPVEQTLLSWNGSEFLQVMGKIFLGFFNTVGSYSFLFIMVSLLYLIRDKADTRLFLFETVSFFSGVFYALYRTLYICICKYQLIGTDGVIVKVFSSESVMYILGLVEYFLFIVMCFVIIHSYNLKVADEMEEKNKQKKKMKFAPKIYNTDHIGMDSLEDQFFLACDEEDVSTQV